MKTTCCQWFGALATLALLIFSQSSTAHAQGTAFSYQGQLNTSGAPANGSYDIDFTLYTTNLTGVPIAGPVTNTAVIVSNGLFSTMIDFGNAYSGESNWVEIAVSTNEANTFTTLAPRQQLLPIPYAVTAANLSGTISPSQLNGPISQSQLPGSAIVNGESGVYLNGGFSGDGSGLTGLNASQINGMLTSSQLPTTTAYMQQPLLFTPFTSGPTLGVGNKPVCVISADVNGDGKPDLIAVNEGDGTMTVLTNNGSGGFVQSQVAGIGGNPSWVVAADFNGDGAKDLAFAIQGDFTAAGAAVTILTNNNDHSGTFTFSQSLNTGRGPVGIAAGDFNDDGKMDLVTANLNDSTMTVLTNNGTGQFAYWLTIPTGYIPSAVIAVDVNGDHKTDLVCANGDDEFLTIETNNGDGSGFTLAQTPGLSYSSEAVAAADLNGDGSPDLITANWDGSISVLTNNNDGSGTFSSSQNIYFGDQHYSVATGDFNRDGRIDIAVANLGDPGYSGTSSVLVMTNDGTGVFSLAQNAGVGTVPNSITTADLLGNGRSDIITANYYDNTLSTLFDSAQITNQTFAGIDLFTNSGDVFDGNGSGLTGLNAASIASGTLAAARLPASVVTNNEINVTLTGVFSGNGGSLTNLNYNNINNPPVIPSTNGFVTASITNGFATTNYVLTRGYITNGNVAMLSSNQTFTGSNVFQVVDSYQGLRVTDGSTNSNVSIQPLAGGNSGFQAINFNGYYNAGEHIYNTNKARWRIFVEQRGTSDSFNIDEYYNGVGNVMLTINTNGTIGGNAVVSQGNLGSTNSFTPTIGNSSANFTTTTSSGYYAKVGNLVYFEDWVVWSSKGSVSSGNIVLSLPPVPIVSSRVAFNIGYINGISVTNQLIAFASAGSTTITLGAYSSTGVSIVQASNCGATGELQITGTYRWQ